jgi:hypothetical protein
MTVAQYPDEEDNNVSAHLAFYMCEFRVNCIQKRLDILLNRALCEASSTDDPLCSRLLATVPHHF